MIDDQHKAKVPSDSPELQQSPCNSNELVEEEPDKCIGTTRREFFVDSAGLGLALAAGSTLAADGSEAVLQSVSTSGELPVNLEINGNTVEIVIEPRVTLLDALRNYAGLTGAKRGCDHGQCGACTVHVDGRRTNSCLTLAMMHQGQKITTIEGITASENLHPMQAAFLTYDGFQCGFCTPGQIMSAIAMVEEGRAHSEEEIKEQMSGNICRCGAYPNIVAAIREVLEGKKNAAV